MLGFASDFDRTLYQWDTDEHISAADLDAVRRFREAGHLFGVSTGRSLVGVTMASEGLVDFDFYILATGALILGAQQQVLSRKVVDVSVVRELYAAYDADNTMIVQANDTVYSFDDTDIPSHTKVSTFAEIGPNIYGVSIAAGSSERAGRITAEINERWGSAVAAYTNASIVDVAPVGCSKGGALRQIKELLGITRMGAIGDSHNDLPMLEAADVSYTFGFAPMEVQTRATRIVDSVSEALATFEEQAG